MLKGVDVSGNFNSSSINTSTLKIPNNAITKDKITNLNTSLDGLSADIGTLCSFGSNVSRDIASLNSSVSNLSSGIVSLIQMFQIYLVI